MTEDISKALGPIFKKNPDYETIFPAMCMCMARVIQSTPDRGDELLVMEDAYNEIKHALNQFLAIEREKEATKAKLDAGIAGFTEMCATSDGEYYGPASGLPDKYKPTIEPGSAGDYPDNPNQNVAKTVAPFRDQEGNLTKEGFDQLKKDVVDLHTPDEIQKAMVEEERAFNELTKLPEGAQAPEGLVNFGPKYTDPLGVFVEPPANDEYTPGEGPYSEP